MKITRCLLDSQNQMKIQNTTVSEKVLQQNKEYLWEARESEIIEIIVIHYTSASEISPDDPYNLEAVIEVFIKYGVSSHYLIDRTGIIYNLVPDDKKAWHCGGSIMPEPDSRRGVNEFSIGIELMALQGSGFTDAQYDSLAMLCFDLEKRHQIKKYVGHEDIAGERAVKMGLRENGKTDPGPLFEWDRFYNLKSSYNV